MNNKTETMVNETGETNNIIMHPLEALEQALTLIKQELDAGTTGQQLRETFKDQALMFTHIQRFSHNPEKTKTIMEKLETVMEFLVSTAKNAVTYDENKNPIYNGINLTPEIQEMINHLNELREIIKRFQERAWNLIKQTVKDAEKKKYWIKM